VSTRGERDRCEHAWWARFRHARVSLEKWSNREIKTKTEAEAIFDDLRKAVRAGTFEKRRAATERETTALTFRQFADIYKERHVFAKKLAIGRTIDYRLKPILDYFCDRPLVEIRTADVEDFITDLRKPRIAGRRKTPRVLAPASINRTIEILRHMMNWAVGREYIDRTPFRRGTETLIRKLREDNQRRRRISEDEEARLLAAAPPLLRSMIITALDTGTRQGEMLALRFADIDFARGLITLRGETTKSRKTRFVPIATARLRAVLEWLQLDADGRKKADDALVFSDETGEPLGRFRTAWVTTVLKAHAISPEWKSYNWTALTPECVAEFRRIDLRWHDLRHEYASRLVERNVPLAQVRDLLGHASITTTERYDNQKLENLQAAAARLERGETFDPGPRESTSPSICQVSVKSSVDEEPGDEIDRVRETSPKYGEDFDLADWLGGRDSNPDTVVQRTVHGVSSAPFPAFSGRSSRRHLRQLLSVSLLSCAACLTVSQPLAPTGFPQIPGTREAERRGSPTGLTPSGATSSSAYRSSLP
jgi:integrase